MFSFSFRVTVFANLRPCREPFAAAKGTEGDGNAITMHIHEQTGSKLAQRDNVLWCSRPDGHCSILMLILELCHAERKTGES